MTLSRDKQQLSVDAIVSLIKIDARPIGGTELHFTNGSDNGAAVQFDNKTWRALPSRITGVASGGRRAAEPVLEVAEEDATLLALIAGREDLAGAMVTRKRTLAKYLTGQSTADNSQHWPEEKWRISGLARQEDGIIAWRLGSLLATDGTYIPRRQVLRDVCGFEYRRWNGTAWDHKGVECPYKHAENFYNLNDELVSNAAEDACSRRLSGCRARFGEAAALPFGGFIGVGREQR